MAAPWERYGGRQQGTVFTPPPSPEQQAEQRRKDAAEARAQADQARQERADRDRRAKDEQDLQLKRQQLAAELAKQGKMLDANGNVVPIPDYKPPLAPAQQAAQSNRVGQLNGLVDQINQVQLLGNKSVFGTPSFTPASLMDYLPTGGNNRFDTAGKQLGQQGFGAFRVPGVGSQSDYEGKKFDAAYAPSSNYNDATNDEILDGLRSRVESEFRTLGLPAPQWQGVPGSSQQRQDQPPIIGAIPGQSSMADHDTGGSGPASPASGALLGPKQRQEYDWDAQKRINSLIYSNAPYEQIDAEARRLGYTGGISRIEYDRVTEYRRKHPEFRGSLVNAPLRTVDQSILERGAQGAPGATAIGYTNAATYGGVGMLAPEKMAMAQQAHPIAEGIGEIAGVFAGQKMGGNILGGLGSRIAPSVAGRMSAGFRALPAPARNLIADTGYGTVRGAVENPDDPLAGALMGGGVAGAGSVVGQGLGKGAGFVLGGAKMAPGVRALLDAKVPMTTGQMLGGFGGKMLRGVEDRMMSVPVVGDMIRNRRMDSLEGLQRAVQNEAGAPIGAEFPQAGNWADELPPQFGQAYDNATNGVSTQLDDLLRQDMGAVNSAARRLPPDYNKAFNEVADYRINPTVAEGVLTGQNYHQAMRGLKSAKSKADNIGNSGFENEYRTVLSDAQAALKGQMMRGGGERVVTGLKNADQAYGMAKTIQSAQQAAKGRPVTPNMLATAASQTRRKFGTRPFAELTDAAQQVLPQVVPDSGTAGRLAQMSALPILGGGAGYATGGSEGAMKGAIIAGLLAAGGTKSGQAGINALLFNRPEMLRKLAPMVAQQQGMLGTNIQRAVGVGGLLSAYQGN